MATAQYGIAYLDLTGNRVNWTSADKNHTSIILDGTSFGGTINMAMLAISALCLLCFFALFFGSCWAYCGDRKAKLYLPWSGVWVPMFCMIGFFILDLANRVCHELWTGKSIPSGYIAIDIPMGALTNIADVALMYYLLEKCPVQPRRRLGTIAVVIMRLAIAVYALGSLCSKGTQIWSLVLELEGHQTSNETPADLVKSTGDASENRFFQALAVFQQLSAAIAAIVMAYAIGFAGLCFAYIGKLRQTHKLYKRLGWTAGALCAAFLIRSILNFIFWLIYAEFGHIASYGVQLVYLAFYGPLSVAIYLSIILIAVAQGKEEALPEEPVYSPVAETAVYDGAGWQWQPKKPEYNVRTTHF